VCARARGRAARPAVSGPAPTMAKVGNITQPCGARCVVGASGAAAGWRRGKSVPGSAGREFLPCYPSLYRARHGYARWPRPTWWGTHSPDREDPCALQGSSCGCRFSPRAADEARTRDPQLGKLLTPVGGRLRRVMIWLCSGDHARAGCHVCTAGADRLYGWSTDGGGRQGAQDRSRRPIRSSPAPASPPTSPHAPVLAPSAARLRAEA
jgi:hypothetical protein